MVWFGSGGGRVDVVALDALVEDGLSFIRRTELQSIEIHLSMPTLRTLLFSTSERVRNNAWTHRNKKRREEKEDLIHCGMIRTLARLHFFRLQFMLGLGSGGGVWRTEPTRR